MKGKEKCRMLREIRRQIAEQNDIALVTRDCTYQGECRGTCPKCESELAYLERELEKRRARRQRVALAGVSLGLAVGMTGCSADGVRTVLSLFDPSLRGGEEELAGDVPYIEPLEGEIEQEMGEVEYCPPEQVPDGN